MSRKSSWWLRPQRKGASNRAALNESKYFMEHNKILQERIVELGAENAKMRELVEDMLSCIEIRAAFGRPPTDEMYETFAQRARELGMEVEQ